MGKKKNKKTENKTKTSEPIPTISKKAKLTGNIIVLIFSIIIIIIGIKAFNGDLNEVHPYLGNKIFEGGFIVQQNPDFPPELNMQVILKTDSLSAHNPITVEAKMFPNENILSYTPDPWSFLPEKQYLLFPYAQKFPIEKDSEGFTKSAFIELIKSNTLREYRGTGKIVYDNEGEYGFFFSGPKTMSEHQKGFSTSWDLSEIQQTVLEESKFTVGSIEQTNDVKKTNYALSGFIIGTLLVSLWKFHKGIIDGLNWVFQFKHILQNKKKTVFGIGFILSLITLTVFLIIISIQNNFNDESVIGNVYYNRFLHFKINRPNSDWFFIQEFWHNKDRFEYSLPDHQVVGGVIVQQTINEKVSVLVFQGTEVKKDLLEFVSKDFSYNRRTLSDQITATYFEGENTIELEGYFQDPFLEVKGKIIAKDTTIYLILGEFFETPSEEKRQDVSEIIDSFKISDLRYFY